MRIFFQISDLWGAQRVTCEQRFDDYIFVQRFILVSRACAPTPSHPRVSRSLQQGQKFLFPGLEIPGLDSFFQAAGPKANLFGLRPSSLQDQQRYHMPASTWRQDSKIASLGQRGRKENQTLGPRVGNQARLRKEIRHLAYKCLFGPWYLSLLKLDTCLLEVSIFLGVCKLDTSPEPSESILLKPVLHNFRHFPIPSVYFDRCP